MKSCYNLINVLATHTRTKLRSVYDLIHMEVEAAVAIEECTQSGDILVLLYKEKEHVHMSIYALHC